MKIVKIGRDVHNDIVINDGYVSSYHCQIMQDDNGALRIVDTGSKNGTFVNGVRVYGEAPLRPTDVVRIGNSTPAWQNYFHGAGGNGGYNNGYNGGYNGGYNNGYNNGKSPQGGIGFGIAALSCGVVGLSPLMIVLGPLAVIFGGISMYRKERLKGMGIAGLVLGIVEVVWGLIAVIAAGTVLAYEL